MNYFTEAKIVPDLTATHRAFLFACEAEGFLSSGRETGVGNSLGFSALLMLSRTAKAELSSVFEANAGAGGDSEAVKPLVYCDALALALFAAFVDSNRRSEDVAGTAMQRAVIGWLNYRQIDYTSLAQLKQLRLPLS